MNTRRLTALVVHESMFRNTANIAEAIAEGLTRQGMQVTIVDVADAPALNAVDADLLVVGAPTHAFSLSWPSTRAEAVRQGAPADHAQTGVREWLGAGSPVHDRARLAAVFDTRLSTVSRPTKSAGSRGGHVLERLGFTLLQRPEPFLVDDVKGPLRQGETERAVMWGHHLAHQCQERLATTPPAAHPSAQRDRPGDRRPPR